MAVPAIKQDDMYQLLREELIEEFNKRQAKGEQTDLTNCDFRGLDLKGLKVAGLDFSGSYFRQTDLRGIDFSQSKLVGTSLNGAKVSGCYFPPQLSAVEITLSIEHGTRMRYSKG